METLENHKPHMVPSPIHELTPRHLSTTGTVLSAIVVVAIGFIGLWMSWSSHRLSSVANPEAALSLIVGRMMELRDEISRGSAWERQLYSILLINTPKDIPIAIAWYEELVSISDEATAGVELAILEAENGRKQKVADRVAAWRRLSGVFPAFAELIDLAYLASSDSGDQNKNFDPGILGQLEPGWFRDRLTARLVAKLGSDALPTGDQHLGVSLTMVRVFVAANLVIVLAGFLFLVRIRSDRAKVVIGEFLIPPAWHTSTAFAVVLRCAAAFLVMATGIGFLAPVLKIGEPLILLTAYWAGFTVLRNLLRKFPLNNTSQTVAEIFGLTVRVRKVIVWAIVLIALTTLGDLGVIWMADLFGFEIHWTEWFLEDLVWGNYLELGLLLIAVIVAAPIFEELLFRGLIFATLRQHFSFGAAAISSAALFSIWHGYGIAGSCALLWGSCLSAWSVEKTKSLLPAIIAHTANNFLMALGLIVYLRV